MRKEIFKQIVAEFEQLGINPTKWLGTRTNVKRIGKTNLSATPINKYAIQREFDEQGIDRILKLFEEEGRYLAHLDDMEASQLLANLKTTNKIVNPAPKPEAGIYTLKEGKKLTADEFKLQKDVDQGKVQSAILRASMNISEADSTLAKRLNLDMSKISDYEKLQAWKKEHGVPDFTKDEAGGSGISSLFKTLDDNPLADLGTQLDSIKKQGKSLADEAKNLVDLAWRMSPEGQAAEEAIRKDILRRGSEGKGFAGGVFGARNDGYFRAIVRPFLLKQHENGIIKLADNTLESLKQSNDLKGGGDFMSADPVRVFRQHYGDDAFDLIPDQEAFGMGDTGYGPGRDRINEVMEKVIGKPILKVGPDNPGGYLTKGEYQAKLDHEDEVLGYIKNGDGRFGEMSKKEIAEEIAQVKATKSSLMMAFRQDHPTANFQKKDFRSRKEWEQAEIEAQAAETLAKNLEGTGVTQEGFVDPSQVKKQLEPEVAAEIGPGETSIDGRPYEISGIDKTLKSDFTKAAGTKKKIDRPSIRLMKNFDQELDDIGLAKEGYNLQEIGILKRARQVMKDEGQNPDDALTWVRGEMADDAGVDIEEFMPDFDWGDFPGKDGFAQGGGVGSMFRRV